MGWALAVAVAWVALLLPVAYVLGRRVRHADRFDERRRQQARIPAFPPVPVDGRSTRATRTP